LAVLGVSGPFWRPAGVAFTSTPRGGALYPIFRGFWRGAPAGLFWESPGTGVVLVPGGGLSEPRAPRAPRAGDRAPARGVDVKPPPRRRPGTGPRSREARRALPRPLGNPRGDPGRVVRTLRGPGDLRIQDPDPAPGVVLHQPLAAGPCPRPATGSGTGVPEDLCPEPGQATPAPHRGVGAELEVVG